MGVCFDPFFCLDWQKFGFVRWYSHVLLSSEPPNTKWNWHLWKHLTSEWELIFVPIIRNLIRAPNSDQLRCKRVRMHSSWMSSWLNHWPSLVCTRKNNSIVGQTTREILIEMLIETWLARYWDFIGESRLSCMSTISLDHTDVTILTEISPNKNSYPDTRDAELNPKQYLVQVGCGVVSGVPCFWGCWLMHRYRGMNALRTSVSLVKLLI